MAGWPKNSGVLVACSANQSQAQGQLLEGANATSETLTNYLRFTSDGTNTTLEVTSQGNSGPGSGSPDQTIVLDGVDLIALYGSNDATIISNLMTANKLVVD